MDALKTAQISGTGLLFLLALSGNPWFVWPAIVALVVCPPKYDPAIAFKEWTQNDRS